MKNAKRIISCILAITMILINIPLEVFAAAGSGDLISIDNGYIKYSINKKTGGFSVSTLTGHPQKKYDDNIPLLFREDNSSTETSFTTVRIDGKDYIFGQDYGWFGIDSEIYEPVADRANGTIITKWVIKGVEVTQKVAISRDKNNDLCGNAGIAYEIKNTNSGVKTVGVRTLLDTALGDLDSPYMIAGFERTPTITEREFSGEDVPDQIRGVDSAVNPNMMSYSILKGWSEGAAPDRVIIAHWANLANTRYDYTPNKNCDFSNYSSIYRTPDSALAFYWSEDSLASNEVKKAEFLYGIGNFSSELEAANVNINMDVDRVYVNKDSTGYENDGIFEVRAEVDNTVDKAGDISLATLSLSLDYGLSIVEERIEGDSNLAISNDCVIDNIPAGTIAMRYWRVKAQPLTTISSKQIVVALSTNTTEPVSASRYVILPSATGGLPDISFDSVTPNQFYILGDKNINISGNLEAFRALAGKAGWSLFLRHVATGDLVEIEKEKIAFTGESLNTLSITTDEELSVGEYEIVFKFSDVLLIEDFTHEITVKQKIEVCLDESLRNKSYGIIAVVRYDKDKYKFETFRNEQELIQYRADNYLNNYDSTESELLLEVRGKIQEFTEGDKVYYAVDPVTSEVTINNIVQYTGAEPLVLKEESGTITLSGDGRLSVVDNLSFWNSGFEIRFQTGIIHTLVADKVKIADAAVSDVMIIYTGAGRMIQNIGGMTIDLKYGVLTESWAGSKDDEREGYAINFGGKMALTFMGGGKDKDKDKDDGGTGGGGTGGGTKPDDSDEYRRAGAFDEGAITADIENVLYGETGDSVDFIGINTRASLSLPQKAFGGFIENPPGIYAEITINTLDSIYALAAGVQLFVIECTGELRIKIVEINDVRAPIPDKLYFSLGSDVGVPIVPGVLNLTGLGGGYDNLADTITGNYMGSLPPLTLSLEAGLKVVSVLQGDFYLTLGLKGMSLTGILTIDKIKGLLIDAGISTQWVDPWYVYMYFNLDVFEVIKGGVAITIAEDYFYGYGYVRLQIPSDIPIIGGITLAELEAAVNKMMIGMNAKVLSVKFGVVYYWDSGDVNFGDTIDLGGMKTMRAMHIEREPFGSEEKDALVMYGTNVRRLSSSLMEKPSSMMRVRSFALTADVTKDLVCEGSDALIFAIPYTGEMIPATDMITLINPEGIVIELTLDQSMYGKEEGNFLVQDLGEKGKYIYISVIDPSLIVDGLWTVSSSDPMVEINNFEVNAVENIPELSSVDIGVRDDKSSLFFDVTWDFDSEGSKLNNATVDIYLTKNKNVVEEAKKKGVSDTENLGICIGQYPSKDKHAAARMPDTLGSGTYYAVAVLSPDDCGPSIMSCKTPIVFENTEIPLPVKAVAASYGGNGAIKVDITDPESFDYTHYNVFVVDEANNAIEGTFAYYEAGSSITLGGSSILTAGQKYRVIVQTVKERDGKKYSGDINVFSNTLEMTEADIPVLLDMESNIGSADKYSNEGKLSIKYTFDQDVNLKVYINGGDSMRSDEYKSLWEFDMALPDGEYMVTIEAVNKSGDSYTVSIDKAKLMAKSLSVSPVLAFAMDTTIPVLRIGSYTEDSIEGTDEAVISRQTVWLKDGILTLNGMSEPASTILLDGSSHGITVKSDGTFTIKRAVDMAGTVKKSMVLTVTDKAGNHDSMVIYVIDGDLTELQSLSIKLLGDDGKLYDIEPIDDLKTIIMSTGDTVSFDAVNSYLTSGGSVKEFDIMPEQLNWSVIYGSPLIDFSAGKVYAKAPGDVVIKAGTLSAGFKKDEEDYAEISTEDIVILKIQGDPVYDIPVKTDSGSGTSLAMLMNRLITLIGKDNVLKAIGLQSSRQASEAINESLAVIVPINSVDKNDILLIYIPKDADELKYDAPGIILGSVMTMATVTGEELKKPVVFVHTYSKSDISGADNIGLYRYNRLFGKWEYVLGQNNVEAKRLTAETLDMDAYYAFIDNPDFAKFSDISDNWAEKYIYRLSSLSVINGIKAGDNLYFYPGSEITRAEFIKLAVAAMRLNPDDYKNVELPFADAQNIPTWAVNYIKAAYKNVWIAGKATSSGLTVDSQASITREEAVTILHRIKAAPHKEVSSSFTDTDKISIYAKDAVENFTLSKIINGYTDGSFKPSNNIARNEAAKIIAEWILKVLEQ